DRIYVTGLSMGGYGTWDIIVREPHRFAAAAPICSDGDKSKVGKIKHIPIWISHGAKDPIVDVKYSRQMYAALKNQGGNVTYRELPNGVHNIWDQVYSDPEFIRWLFEQRKSGSSPTPKGQKGNQKGGKQKSAVP